MNSRWRELARSPGASRGLRRCLRVTTLLVLTGCGLLGAGRLALCLVPLPAGLFANRPAELEFLDRHGEPLRVVPPDLGPYHHAVRYSDTPTPLIEATLAAEDRRFWSHRGVDWRATLRAGWQLVRYRRIISGGSTITQQLIKLAQPRPRTLRSKLIEALQALRLEQVWSKQQILGAYLERLDYGNFNRGCTSAARYYFGKPLDDLSPAECALLAGLPQAPTRLNPHLHFVRSHKRQQWVLTQMRAQGWLSMEEYERAFTEQLHLVAPRRAFEAPHFVDLLLAQRRSLQTSAPIHTTLDLSLNRLCETSLRRHLAQLEGQRVGNGAIVVVDNSTGDVLSLVGSENYFAPGAGQVNGAYAPRSAGSTFKPFTYLLALEQGATPATVVADVPTEFATATGLFVPVNYNRHCYGPMRYRLALANSLNISAVKVLASVGGPEPLEQLLRRCGLTTLNRTADSYGLGLTIGNAEARLLELANAYATLARLGLYRPLRLSSNSATGKTTRIADASAAYLIADILSDNDARIPAFGAESPLRSEFPVACKTGTSSDFRDNWAFGYTPEFTVGVWVGNFDNTPMEHVSGVTGAAPILHDIFEILHARFGTTWYPTPPNIAQCLVHPVTGKRLRGPSPGSAQEKFVFPNLPPYESQTDYAIDPASGNTDESAKPVRLGSEYAEWFASGDNWLVDRAVLTTVATAPQISFPLPGTILYLDPDLPQDGRRLRLRTAGSASVQWQSESLSIVSRAGTSTALLVPGRHELLARDPTSGSVSKTWISVLER